MKGEEVWEKKGNGNEGEVKSWNQKKKEKYLHSSLNLKRDGKEKEKGKENEGKVKSRNQEKNGESISYLNLKKEKIKRR